MGTKAKHEEAAKRLEEIAAKLDFAEARAHEWFIDLANGKTGDEAEPNIFLALRALCLNTLHFTAKDLRALAALESSTQTGGLDGIANKLADFLERLKNGDENLADVVDDLTEYILKLREASTQTPSAELAKRTRDTWEEVQHSIANKGYVDEGHRGAFDSIISQIASLESKPTQTQEGVRRKIEKLKADYETHGPDCDHKATTALQDVLDIIDYGHICPTDSETALLDKKATEKAKE